MKHLFTTVLVLAFFFAPISSSISTNSKGSNQPVYTYSNPIDFTAFLPPAEYLQEEPDGMLVWLTITEVDSVWAVN